MARFEDVIQRGIRADQPLASDVSTGALYCVTDEGLIIERSNGTTWDAYSGTSAFSGVVQGRLTTESGVPVSTVDRTAQGTIYFTPSIGSLATTIGYISLYTGSSVTTLPYTELSLALTATSGNNYDVFVDYNSGTPTLVLSAAWTNDTTRADALGVQSGLIVKSGTATYRWVGTIRASGANITADSNAFRYVWNAYNQAPSMMKSATETTDTWNYTTATFRQANANTANQLNYVTGDAASLVTASVYAQAFNSGASVNVTVGVGVDSTTVNSSFFHGQTATNSFALPVTTMYAGYPGVGYHFLAWLEYSVASGTTTWVGDGGSATVYQSGISGSLLR